MMNTMKNNLQKIKIISKQSIVIITLYSIIALTVGVICFLPLISELSYRKAYILSTEGKIQNFKYINRFLYSFYEFEKAIKFFPWESHYVIEYIKELETYALNINDPKVKLKVFKRILLLLDRIQLIDEINPWFHSKRASSLYHLYQATKDKQYLLDSFESSRLACFNDYENPIFMINYANILHRTNKLSEAYYYYKKSIDIDDRFAESYFNLADIYTRLNKKPLALNSYLKTKEINKDFNNIDAIILKTYISLNEFKKGESYINTYKLFLSDDLKLIETIVIFYFIQNKFDTAISYYNKYLLNSKQDQYLISQKLNELYFKSLINSNKKNQAKTELTDILTKLNKLDNASKKQFYSNLKKELNL